MTKRYANRDKKILEMYLSPDNPTLQEIANKHRVSRQRIFQITEYFGVRRSRRYKKKKTKDEIRKERFERRASLFHSLCKEVECGCIEWTGYKHPAGYGKFGFSALGENSAHRVSWVLRNGKIEKGLFVLHKCDNPSCVNPDHLYLGTQTQNIADREERFGNCPWQERNKKVFPRRLVTS